MPLPVIASVARVAMRGTCPSGQRWANTFHIHRRAGGVITDAELTTFDNLMQAAWNATIYAGGAQFRTQVTNTTTWIDTVYTRLDGVTPSFVRASGIVGNAGGNSAPSEVSLVVTLRTAQRGRSHRGRIYQAPPGVVRLDVTGGYAAASLANVNAQWAGLLADIVVSTVFELIVASYTHLTTDIVTLASCDSVLDVQRHRKS